MQFTINLEEIEVEYATMYHDECKHTHQGSGTRSLPKRGRKKYRGQGR